MRRVYRKDGIPDERRGALDRADLGQADKGCGKNRPGYKIIKKKGDLALCEIALHTGKTHQIRAHSAYLGVPVLGDTKYGDKALNQKYGKARQCLISKKITLRFSAASPLACANKKTFVSKFDFAAEGF